MDIVEKFILLIVVLQFVWSILERIRGPQAEEQAADFDVADNAMALGVWAENTTEQLERAGERAAVLLDGADQMRRHLRHAQGPLARVAEALHTVIGPLERAAEELGRIRDTVEGAKPEAILEVAENHDHFQRLFGQIYDADLQLGALKALYEVRRDRDREPILADADTLADAMLRQVHLFADAHGVVLPRERPICVPAERGTEGLLTDLFPRHPVVLVPPDFRGDVMRWVSLAHEMGHVLERYVPGLSSELAALIGPTDEPVVPHRAGRRVVYDIDATFARWLPEILADVFAALLLGPAALRGLIHVFQEPDAPQWVVTVSAEADGRTVGAHPPRHLRVMWMGQLLKTLGFTTEAKLLLRQWDRLHGAPTQLIMPTLHGQSLPVPANRFVTTGDALVEQIRTRNWRSLSGHTLGAVSGLEMSPGVWARVERRARALLEDVAFNDDPLVVVAAAIEALGLSPAAQGRVSQGVLRAIVSDSIDEGRVADANYVRRERDDWVIGLDDVVDAMVLRAAWYPRETR